MFLVEEEEKFKAYCQLIRAVPLKYCIKLFKRQNIRDLVLHALVFLSVKMPDN